MGFGVRLFGIVLSCLWADGAPTYAADVLSSELECKEMRLDAWRYRHPVEGQPVDHRQSSGLAMSMVLSADDPLATNLNGGFACESVLKALSLGGCDKDVVLSRFEDTSHLGFPVQKLLRQYARYQKADRKGKTRVETAATEKVCMIAEQNLKETVAPTMHEVLLALNEPSGLKMLTQLLLDEVCEDPGNILPAGSRSATSARARLDTASPCKVRPFFLVVGARHSLP